MLLCTNDLIACYLSVFLYIRNITRKVIAGWHANQCNNNDIFMVHAVSVVYYMLWVEVVSNFIDNTN